jgi:diguanylate cyclase (GGDEF)-like protein/PAS domain S-box-containing protein
MIRQDPGAGTSLRRRGSVFRTTIALACAALAVVGLVTASTWLSLGFVSETFTARERDQFFIYQARVEHLRLVATLTAAAHGEATEQEARQKLDVFLGRLDTLRTAPVLEQLRQDPKMARAVAQLTRVAQEIDARAPFQVDDWLRARVEEASEPLRIAAEAVLAATVSRQQSRYEALIFRLKAGAFVFLALVSIVLGLAIMAGLQARRIARQAEEEQRLAARMQLQAAAMESAANAIFATDAALRIVWVNAAFERLSGYAAQEILGHTPALLTQGLPGAAASQDAWARVVAGEVWRGEARLRRKSGELFSVEQTITPIRGESGAVEQVVAVLDDITEQLQARERIQHMARHDLLTHLPNRAAFLERVGEAVARAQRAGSLVGVVLLDLDRFKEVNDTLGHSTGDALLCAVGQRLAAGLRQTELLARLGGDEFALVLEGLADVAQARQAVERLVAALGESFEVGGHSLQASASLGVALYPADGVEGVELLRHADLAMYAAKGNGPLRYRFFEAAMDRDLRERVGLMADLRQRAHDGMWVAYQPQVDLRTGAVVGLEALMRWNHPQRGAIPPDRFIPLAEVSGSILELGQWLLEQVSGHLLQMDGQGLGVPRVAVNLSAVQFEQDTFVEQLLAVLRRHGLPPARVELEFTEGLLMGRSPRVEDNLRRLVEAGFEFAVDDFGTGYSSLEYLRRFPVHRLKIDASFVQGIGHSRDDEAIVCAVIDLAHSLGLAVLAEGVETVEQRDFLLARGCDQAQGFLFARPQPLAELQGSLRTLAAAAVR